MALLRPKLEGQIRRAYKDCEWGESVDDLFDSFIDPDSINFPDDEVQRLPFGNHVASGGSGKFDTSPMLDTDARSADSDFSRLYISAFEEKPLRFSTNRGLRKSVYPASCGKSAGSESDLPSLDQLSNTQLASSTSTILAHSPSRPFTPIGSNFKEFTTSLVVRKKHLSAPTPIGKLSNRVTGPSVKMISPSNCKEEALWARQIGDSADQQNPRIPFEGRPTTPQLPLHLRNENLIGYPVASDRSQSGPYVDEIEPLSPLSSIQHHFQPPNTPIASPAVDDRQQSAPSSFHEALAASFPKTPMNQNSDRFSSLMTPPQSSQMPSTTWMSGLDDQSISASPAFSHSGYKADSWWLHATANESSCCSATPSNGFSGLGIHGLQMSDDFATASSLMMPCDPSPSFTAPMAVTTTPSAVAPSLITNGSNPISASASPNTSVPYPLSPLQTMNQSQRQALQCPQQQQQQPTFYRRDQRHCAVGTPIAIGQTGSYNTRSARFNSASPQPMPARQHHHRRSKTSYHSRRRSGAETKNSAQDGSRSASIGFVNYTPEDSRKILTGVAPSGSSKTKARREKEAAEKRRKLSEAAKKAVLEAGGDLETLEREGLLVMEHGI